MVKKPDREEGKCDLADGQDMQAREASPEAGGHSLLLDGGLAGMESHAGLARGCDGPKQGMSLLPPCTGKREKRRRKRDSQARDTPGNWRDQRANVSRAAAAPNDSSSAAVEKALRMRRAGSGMQLLKGACIPRLEIVADTGGSLDWLLAGEGIMNRRKKGLVLPIVTLEHLELDWHRKAVGKRIKSYEVSANSQQADPAMAGRGDGELSEQIHQSNQIVQIFQAGTGNACNWAKLEIETKRHNCLRLQSREDLYSFSKKSSRRE